MPLDHIIPPSKKCSKCGIVKLAACFSRDKNRKSGLQPACKDCYALWKKANRAHLREQNREWVKRNPEKMKALIKDWTQRNPEKNAARQKRYHERHPGRSKEQHDKWRKAHPENVRAWKTKSQAKRNYGLATGQVLAKDLTRQYAAQAGKCYYCADSIATQYEIDHVVPLSRGGLNEPSNIVLACPRCNRRKNNKCPWEWPEGGRLC